MIPVLGYYREGAAVLRLWRGDAYVWLPRLEWHAIVRTPQDMAEAIEEASG